MQRSGLTGLQGNPFTTAAQVSAPQAGVFDTMNMVNKMKGVKQDRLDGKPSPWDVLRGKIFGQEVEMPTGYDFMEGVSMEQVGRTA